METKKTFSKLNAIFNNVDGSKQNQNIFIKFPDYAWPKYFGAYMELLLIWYVCVKSCRGLVYGCGGGEGGWRHTLFFTYLRGSKILTRREIGGRGGGDGGHKTLW